MNAASVTAMSTASLRAAGLGSCYFSAYCSSVISTAALVLHINTFLKSNAGLDYMSSDFLQHRV